MFISIGDLKSSIYKRIVMLKKQGYEINEWEEKLNAVPDSYDALIAFAHTMNGEIKIRADFPYNEPDGLENIKELRPEEHKDFIQSYISETEIKDKVYGGVAGRMVGCILGKPLDVVQ